MTLTYPYIPSGRSILYVEAENLFMQEARAFALAHSLDEAVKTGSVVVKDGVVIGRGTNGSDYHKTHVCERVVQKMPTGQGYELCEGCHPKNHSESRAITDAIANGHDVTGADLYLWGHWWACEPCWNAIISANVKDVYLMKNSEVLFDRNNPNNILGKWG
jgi:deoxycytidylate deaminase